MYLIYLISLIYMASANLAHADDYRVSAAGRPGGTIDVEIGFADAARSRVYVRGSKSANGHREIVNATLPSRSLKRLIFEAPGLPGDAVRKGDTEKARADGGNGGRVTVRLARGAELLAALVDMNVEGGRPGVIETDVCAYRVKNQFVGKILISQSVRECSTNRSFGLVGGSGESRILTSNGREWDGEYRLVIDNIDVTESRADSWLAPNERVRVREFNLTNAGSVTITASRLQVELVPGTPPVFAANVSLPPGASLRLRAGAEYVMRDIQPQVSVDGFDLPVSDVMFTLPRGYSTVAIGDSLDLTTEQPVGVLSILVANRGSLESPERHLRVTSAPNGPRRLQVKDEAGVWLEASRGVTLAVPRLASGQAIRLSLDVRADLVSEDHRPVQVLSLIMQNVPDADREDYFDYVPVGLGGLKNLPSVDRSFAFAGTLECEFVSEPEVYRPIKTVKIVSNEIGMGSVSYTSNTWQTPPMVTFIKSDIASVLNALVFDQKLSSRQMADLLPRLTQVADKWWRIRTCRVNERGG